MEVGLDGTVCNKFKIQRAIVSEKKFRNQIDQSAIDHRTRAKFLLKVKKMLQYQCRAYL
jgi:hypothetical protein